MATGSETMSQLIGPYLQEKRRCMFYKLMVASIIQDKKLRLPNKFVRKFGDELSSTTKLMIPNGRSWLVELRKDNKKLWFDNGWHDFVEHCSIHVGYFLLFNYQGNSDFNVQIFDLATSEIKYPLDTSSLSKEPSDTKQCSDPLEKDIEDNNSLNISASFPSCPSLTPSSSMNKVFYEGVCHNWNENCKSRVGLDNLHQIEAVHNLQAKYQSTRDIGIQLNENELTDNVDEVELHLNGTEEQVTNSGPGTDSCEDKVEEKLPGTRISLYTSKRSWRAVTIEEKKRLTVRAAEKFKSGLPFFKVILRQYHICRGFHLHIPITFARKYLNGLTGFITLQSSDGNHRWLVRCVSRDRKVKLGSGWPLFVKENNLDEGDVCIFELVKTNEIALKVTIFRVLEGTEPGRKHSKYTKLISL